MTNIGHFIDRLPNVRAAGITMPINITIKQTFNEQPDANEMAEQLLMQRKCDRICSLQPTQRELILKYDNDLFGRTNEDSQFSEFRKNFLEQLMFKRAELGKAYNFKTKPDHIDNENTTFGRKTYRPEANMSVLLKPGDRMLVPIESMPSRQINRNYTPPFVRSGVFGIKTKNVDKRGLKVKNAMQHCDESKILQTTQIDHIVRHKPLLGRRNLQYTYYFPVEQTPLPPIKADECSLKELLEQHTDCGAHRHQIVQAFAYLRRQRRELANNRFVNLYDFLMLLKENDTANKGQLGLQTILMVANEMSIHLDMHLIELVLINLGILQPTDKSQLVDYYKFVDMIDNRIPLIEPQEHTRQNIQLAENAGRETTYRDLLADHSKPPNVMKQLGPCMIVKPDKIELADIIRRKANIKYGLSNADFLKPRDKEQLRRIFENALGQRFELIWSEAMQKFYGKTSGKELLSVQQIKEVLSENSNR